MIIKLEYTGVQRCCVNKCHELFGAFKKRFTSFNYFFFLKKVEKTCADFRNMKKAMILITI